MRQCQEIIYFWRTLSRWNIIVTRWNVGARNEILSFAFMLFLWDNASQEFRIPSHFVKCKLLIRTLITLSFHNIFHLVHDKVHDEWNMCTLQSHKVHKITRRTTFSWTCFQEHGLSCTRKNNFSSPGLACHESQLKNLYLTNLKQLQRLQFRCFPLKFAKI